MGTPLEPSALGVSATMPDYQILRRRPTEGEDTLLVYVADTQSTAATFTDTDVTGECSMPTG